MHMAAKTTPVKTATAANAAVVVPSVGGSKPLTTPMVETVESVDTTTPTRWPTLNAGKPIPSPTEWRALEQRASSFRLR